MKAKALREQREAELAKAELAAGSRSTRTSSNTSQLTQGLKRSHASMNAGNPTPAAVRDARTNTPASDRLLDEIKPARNFTRYVEYDFSKMTDTKGGFLSQEDDPFNRALHVPDEKEAQKPANMTQKEWERHQLLQSLRRNREGPFEPGLSVLEDKSKQKTCRECGSLEIDWKWDEQLRCQICHTCKDKYPDKYSLLTKTEAREDYLLTDREFNLLLHIMLPVLVTDAGP